MLVNFSEIIEHIAVTLCQIPEVDTGTVTSQNYECAIRLLMIYISGHNLIILTCNSRFYYYFVFTGLLVNIYSG